MQYYYNTKWTGIVPYSDQDKGKTHYSALNNWSVAVHYQLCLPKVATTEQPQQSFISTPNPLSLFFPFHSLSQAVQHPLLNTPCLLDWLVESAVQLISFSLLVCVSNSNHRGTTVIKVLYFPITFYFCFILNVLNSGQFQLVSKVVLLVSV